MDKVEPTPARATQRTERPWDDDAAALLHAHVENEPFLVRISAAKRMRERVERDALHAMEEIITADRVSATLGRVAAVQTA